MKSIDQRYLLLGALVYFTMLLFFSEIFFKDDSQLFQVIASLISGFGGAFLKDLVGSKDEQPPDKAHKTVTTIEQTQTDKP